MEEGSVLCGRTGMRFHGAFCTCNSLPISTDGIQIKEEDNVVVAVHDLPAGTTLESGVVTREPIP